MDSECGTIFVFSYKNVFIKSKWTCLLEILANHYVKGLLYFIPTNYLDKVDNCWNSYDPYTYVKNGR